MRITPWSAPRGTPIIAAGNGVVEKAGWDSGGYGNQTLIRHANGYVSSYNHQNAIAKGIKPGVKVRQGQVIGYVGSTGLSTGPHLHFEVYRGGRKVDPMSVRFVSQPQVSGEELARFNARLKALQAVPAGKALEPFAPGRTARTQDEPAGAPANETGAGNQ